MAELFSADFLLERRRVNGIALNVRYDPAPSAARPALLLLHGFPQTHAIWHAVAERLRRRYTLVMPDLRGYGDSDKPEGPADHSAYSKRTMALDARDLMRALGHERFFVCGHDRGGRVAHRLALDHPEAVRALVMLDISPTLTMYERTTMEFAAAYYHWFFLIQPAPLPERLIGADPIFYLRTKVGGWGSGGTGAVRRACTRRVRALLRRSGGDSCDVRGLPGGGDDRSRARPRGRGAPHRMPRARALG